jgi:hypothetical protein
MGAGIIAPDVAGFGAFATRAVALALGAERRSADPRQAFRIDALRRLQFL